MMKNINKLYLPVVGILAFLTGCASTGAGQRVDQPDAVQVSEVIEQPELQENENITWGGTVVNVENRSGETWIEIVERPLFENGLPDLTQNSDGRFLAVVPGFLDPLDYSNGRAITVAGVVEGRETRKISEADYTYPVVAVADHQLWSDAQTLAAARSNRSRRYYPYSYYRHPYRGRLSIGFGHGFGRGFGYSRFGFGSRIHGFGRFGFGRSRGIRGRGSFVSGRIR